MDTNAFYATYTQIQQINKGGTGVIYLAFHRNLGKYVILKRLTIHQDESFIRREVDILKNLRHRFLPTIYDFIEIEGSYFIVEDYIKGSDLTYYINNRITVPEEYVVKWMKQMCEVLEYLHTRQPAVIHSDIKPGNIMVDTNGDICLIDFNISVLCGDRVSVLGFSNYYCAPEQLIKARNPDNKVPIDARTDIYSTAATFYSLLTGRLPSAEQRNRPLAQMDLPYHEGLLRLIDKAMAPKMTDRWQSAKQMRAQFDHLSLLTKRSHFLMGLSAVLCVALLLTACGVAYGSYRNRQQEYAVSLTTIETRYGKEGASEDLVSYVRSFMNQQQYESFLEKDGVALAQLYAILAEYHMGQDTMSGYASASEYYHKAWEEINRTDAVESVKQEYAINYAVALSLSGEGAKATRFAETYLRSNELVSLAIQIGGEYQNGGYAEVLRLAHSIPPGTDYPSIRIRLCKTVAQAAGMNTVDAADGIAFAVSVLETQARQTPSDDLYRYIAAYCLNAGNYIKQQEYYRKSSEYYDKISLKTDEDKLNQAETLVAMNRFSDGIALLKEVESYDQALLCRQNFIFALAYYGNGDQTKAKDHCRTMLQFYAAIPERRREQILDTEAIRRLCQQLGVAFAEE